MISTISNRYDRLLTYVFEASHEVVADGRSRQVGCVGAPSDIEKVIRAQHCVILLGVTRGGQYTIHRYGHLAHRRQMEEMRRARRHLKNE